METRLDALNADEIRADIRDLEGLIQKAEREGSADALAAKNLFLQVIARLERQLSAVEDSPSKSLETSS